MVRRSGVIALLSLALAVPAAAAPAPDYETPQDAIAAVKRILKRSVKGCATDWARIDAVGFRGAWTIDVRVRDSEAGKGLARWRIGDGWPTAANALARALAKGCPAEAP